MTQVLTPRDWGCSPIVGQGDLRLRCGDTEILFSGEDVGWQVAFDGPMPREAAERFVATVAVQVQLEVDEAVEWVQLT
jgi:hypothetical protein